MGLRCLLFTADQETADPIRQVLADLGVEAELCSESGDAAQKVTQQSFHIVIIDWDVQPEAALLLKGARERKASERPLTLAMVSEDASAPQALQAGANSILRKPILANQVKDTLTTARDLLRAKESAAAQAAAAAAASPSPASLPASMSGNEKPLRAGEFLQSSSAAPGGQFETESDVPQSAEQSLTEPVDALRDLEPMAASVAEQQAVAPPQPESQSGEPRGLQWYLNQRASTLPLVPAQASAPLPSSPQAKPEILGFEQMPSPSAEAREDESSAWESPAPAREPSASRPAAREQKVDQKRNRKDEAELMAYVTGVGEESEEKARPAFRLGKGTMIGALVLACCAIVAAPQAPWHGRVRQFWGRGHQALHAWLNPQPVTAVAQAPAAHEDFARAGDEYKLPVAENIPDATTDPSQIRVEPVIDPTAKKPNNAGANDEQATAPADAGSDKPGDPSQPANVPAQTPTASSADKSSVANPASAVVSSDGPATSAPSVAMPSGAAPPAAAVVQPHSDVPVTASSTTPNPQSIPQKVPQVRAVSSNGNPRIPSSLSSQMASMTPEASGNKAPETALDSIEPVAVPEAAERELVTDQPAIGYPASAGGQRGTVVLQVLIGRDGTVQDAKFMQGSLAFARAAIDGVKQWKFKPYEMNGRPVSVQTKLTMSFQPGS